MIYKPQSQLMTPNNVEIDESVDNTFRAVVNGRKISGYIFNLLNLQYNSDGSTNWNTFYNTSNTITTLTTPLYGENEINVMLPADTISTAGSVYLDSELGWRILLLGDGKSGSIKYPLSLGVNHIIVGTINKYGIIMSHTNTITQEITDEITSIGNLTAYSKGWEFILTEKNTIVPIAVGTINGTGVIQTYNNTYITQPITVGTTNISELTEYNDGWVWEVVTNGGTITDVGTVIVGDYVIAKNNFGTEYLATDWTITKIIIRENTKSVVANANITGTTYSDSDWTNITTTQYPQMVITNHGFQTGEQVWISTGTSTGVAYVGVIDSNTCWFSKLRERVLVLDTEADIIEPETIYNVNIMPMAVSEVIPLRAIVKGTFTLTDPIISNTTTYVATPTYSQANNVPINFWQAFLYSGDGQKIGESDIFYNEYVSYTYRGLGRLADSVSYYIQLVATDIYGMEYDTDLVALSVDSDAPVIYLDVTATNNCNGACVDINWGNYVQILGLITPHTESDYSYIDMGDNAYKLQINSNVTLEFNGIDKREEGSVPVFMWQPVANNFTGNICTITNSVTGESYTIFYTAATRTIGHIVDGITFNDKVLEEGLDSTKTYLIAATQATVLFNEMTT